MAMAIQEIREFLELKARVEALEKANFGNTPPNQMDLEKFTAQLNSLNGSVSNLKGEINRLKTSGK